jgi:hypothetical protein
MDDEFMLSGWRKPRADFARKLRQSLDHAESEAVVHRQPRRVMRSLAYAASFLLAVSAFTLPSVRASARAFLDLFRVVNFAPVSVQADQIRKFNPGSNVDLPRLLGDQIVVLKEPSPPRRVTTPQEAAAAAGVPVRLPTWLPVGLEQGPIEVIGEQAVRVTLNTEAVNSLIDAFGIHDLRLPDAVNGESATLHVHPIVSVDYQRTGNPQRRVMLFQGRSPEATLPEGIDLASLAEIGLRVLGLESAEAHRFASSVDWRTTLIVPVPADIATFRQIDVQGSPGLIIETRRKPQQRDAQQGTHILWSARGSVFALMGTVPAEELFEIAQSVQ